MIEIPTDEIVQVTVRQDGRVVLVSHVGRVGVLAFLSAIEWYWYAPGTSRNRFYDLYGSQWRGMHWLICALPAGRLEAAKRLAKQLGLRIADGPPVMLGEIGKSANLVQATSRPSRLKQYGFPPDTPVEFFPGARLPQGQDNPAIFTIENDSGSPVYENRRQDDDAMLQASAEICDALNRGTKLTPAQIADYIYGTGTFPKA